MQISEQMIKNFSIFNRK